MRTSPTFMWKTEQLLSFPHSALLGEMHTQSIMVSNTCTSSSQVQQKQKMQYYLVESVPLNCLQTVQKIKQEVAQEGTRDILRDGLLHIPGHNAFSCSEKKTAIPDLEANVLVSSIMDPSPQKGCNTEVNLEYCNLGKSNSNMRHNISVLRFSV